MAKKKRRSNAKKVQRPQDQNTQEKPPQGEGIQIDNVKIPNPEPSGEAEKSFTEPFEAPGQPIRGDSSKIEQATRELITPRTINPVLDSAFLTAAKFWGDHWKLQPYERDNLSGALCNYLNVVLPEIFKKYPELFALCLTGGVILMPRVAESVKQRKSRKAKGNATEPSKPSTGKSDAPQESVDIPGFRPDSKQGKGRSGTS